MRKYQKYTLPHGKSSALSRSFRQPVPILYPSNARLLQTPKPLDKQQPIHGQQHYQYVEWPDR